MNAHTRQCVQGDHLIVRPRVCYNRSACACDAWARPVQCWATNTSVPGPPELPGDGPGWFSQMRAARLEMRDEGDEAFTALDNWTMQHCAADLDTADTIV